jgi:hypothetical protein
MKNKFCYNHFVELHQMGKKYATKDLPRICYIGRKNAIKCIKGTRKFAATADALAAISVAAGSSHRRPWSQPSPLLVAAIATVHGSSSHCHLDQPPLPLCSSHWRIYTHRRVSQHSKSKKFLRMQTRKPRSNLGDIINERDR